MRSCKVVVLLAVLLLASIAAASDQIENFCPIERDPLVAQTPQPHDALAVLRNPTDPPPYWEGTLRVYVVEHVSSMWLTSDGHPYEFPFLAYAINSDMIALNEGSWDTTVTWDGYDFGYNSLQEDNIAVQAVLFSATNGLPEAAAMADPGVPGSNLVGSGYTHTVFAEEGTATW
ncbi:MAG: hypothetical protein ABIJ61_13790 [bacterium]